MKPAFFKDAREFERWLAANHRKADVLLVGFYKVKSGNAVSDGVYTIRFTPRKKNSYWSAVNTRRAKELIKERRMKAAGLAAFNARDEKRTARYSYERANATMDTAAVRVLRADKKAFTYFQALTPTMQRLYAHWISSAKREETRAKRLAVILERCRAGRRIDPFHPFRSE